MKIPELIQKKKVIIVCGTGGVGKTTLSAAIGIASAKAGKKTLVITMDPAKRLATSLGMKAIGDEPLSLTEKLKEIDPQLQGTLDAIMPDTRKSFEKFFRTLSPHPEKIDQLIQSPLFESFAKEFSGTNEYMAMKRLFMLHQESRYDLIVLDTPPSRNTLGFLEAPKILSRLFEEKLIQWLIVPANRIVAAGMKKVLGLLEKLTGSNFMSELLTFASALFEVRFAFTENLKKVIHLLESDQVAFVLALNPTPDSIHEIEHFIASIRNHHFHFDGVIINRMLGLLGDSTGTSDGEVLLNQLQNRERSALSQIESRISNQVICKLPELARDIHSIEDLNRISIAMSQT